MDRFKLTRNIAITGISANIVLMIIKLVIGFVSNSRSMIADGFNSAGDVFASVMTYAGNKIASKPEDKQHPYGHGKAEYIFSMIISFSLLVVSYKSLSGSVSSIIQKNVFNFSWWLVAVAVATILIKTCLFLYTRHAGRREDNLLIIANSEDHRNDILITLSTLLSIIFGVYNIYWLDGIVGIGISLWIAYTGIRIFLSSYNVLMDTTIDKVMEEKIINIISLVEGVDHIDSISAKPVGVNYILIVKVSVHGDMSVNSSHTVAARIKHNLKTLKNVSDVVVHVNPV
ncbi:MAG TPA: cation transporter [Clostridiaceae bacterium]|nr:cation transporter [Clostridiaceae bacterium]